MKRVLLVGIGVIVGLAVHDVFSNRRAAQVDRCISYTMQTLGYNNQDLEEYAIKAGFKDLRGLVAYKCNNDVENGKHY